jgi:hypothetical protein
MSADTAGEDLGRPGFAIYKAAMMSAFRWRNPRLSRYLRDVRQEPLDVPACLDFRFHSAEATMLLAATLDEHAMWRCFFHETTRLAQQVRRYRSRLHPGLVHTAAGLAPDGRYAPWAEVDACRHAQLCQLQPEERTKLVAASPACPRCGASADGFEWVYFRSAPESWRTLNGVAGWLGVCVPCREQVALFVDRMN